MSQPTRMSNYRWIQDSTGVWHASQAKDCAIGKTFVSVFIGTKDKFPKGKMCDACRSAWVEFFLTTEDK